MAFENLKQTAEMWCQCNGYSLLLADENDRRLVFKNKVKDIVTFFVIYPAPGKTSWHVWSDNDDLLHHLAPIQDALGSCKERSLTEVLNMAHKDFSALLGGGAAAAKSKEDDVDEDFDFDGDEEDEEDFDAMGYYQDEDVDAIEDPATNTCESDNETADNFFTGSGSQTAIHRLLSDMKNLKKSDGQFGVLGGPRNDNLFLWDVKLTNFEKDTLLGQDLEKFAKKYNSEPVVYMEMKFPKDYPMAPPFVRVLRPRFQFLTGHVTIGGSVCMEMLSKSGWRPTNDIESILVQIRSEIMSDAKTRLDSNPNRPYDEAEARFAFERMVARYGWNK